MKDYTFILVPEKETMNQIENMRIKYTDNRLVDGLLPHITLKRRFNLIENFSEDDLQNVFDNFIMPRITVEFKSVERLNEVIALTGENSELNIYHKKLLDALKGKVVTKKPEFENDNFKIHLTIFRNLSDMPIFDLKQKITFDKICLYEIDPSPERAFAHQVKCKNLN